MEVRALEILLVMSTANLAITRDDNDNSRDKDRLEYYTWLAKLAEKGKIASIFIADVYGGISSSHPTIPAVLTPN